MNPAFSFSLRRHRQNRAEKTVERNGSGVGAYWPLDPAEGRGRAGHLISPSLATASRRLSILESAATAAAAIAIRAERSDAHAASGGEEERTGADVR